MARLSPGNYRGEWFVEVSSAGRNAFSPDTCQQAMQSGLTPLVTLNQAVASNDPNSNRNPFARFDRFIGSSGGRAKCTVYFRVNSELDEHNLNVVAATAFKQAFGAYGSAWSVNSNADAFDRDGRPSGSGVLRLYASTVSFGLIDPPAIGTHEASFVPYTNQETAPPPSTVTLVESPSGRDAPSSLVDRAGESLNGLKQALVGDRDLSPSIPLEYKVAGAIVLSIAGLIAIGYAAKQVKGLL